MSNSSKSPLGSLREFLCPLSSSSGSSSGVSDLVQSHGSRNVFAGPLALHQSERGQDNTAIGYECLRKCSASGSSALGSKAAFRLETAQRCTCVGFEALATVVDTPDGDDNTAFGYNAGTETKQRGNSFFGSESGKFNADGHSNCGFGKQSLFLNVKGHRNTSVGTESGYGLMEGDDNVLVGSSAQKAIASVHQVTAVGAQALENNTDHENTAVGFRALKSLQQGQGNTAVGSQVFASQPSGDENTGVGFHVGLHALGSENTVLGATSLASCFPGAVSGSLGLVTKNTVCGNGVCPRVREASGIAVLGSRALPSAISVQDITAIGQDALSSLESGRNNTCIGNQVAQELVTGSGNTCLGAGSGPVKDQIHNSLCLGMGAKATESGELVLGSKECPLQLNRSEKGGTLKVTINGERFLLHVTRLDRTDPGENTLGQGLDRGISG